MELNMFKRTLKNIFILLVGFIVLSSILPTSQHKGTLKLVVLILATTAFVSLIALVFKPRTRTTMKKADQK
jgi:biotin transporter BioY